MKEHGLVFTADSMIAFFKGRKTQTRRLVKPGWVGRRYTVGDRIWTRETWCPAISHSCAPGACDCADVAVAYQACGPRLLFTEHEIPDDWTMPKAAERGWVSPLFQPRWAARLVFELTAVRLEPLQSISDEDAAAEGQGVVWGGGCFHRSFAGAWNAIHADARWDSNPLVVVLTLKPTDGGRVLACA